MADSAVAGSGRDRGCSVVLWCRWRSLPPPANDYQVACDRLGGFGFLVLYYMKTIVMLLRRLEEAPSGEGRALARCSSILR